ncbi:MAG TPA: DUF1893 domain-containing protein [bacterium]|nr:DUF1893 domain-containing protein [bacterium]
MNHTLEVFAEDTLIFASDRNWLYPLLDFEVYLTSTGTDPGFLTVHDKVVGRAAALFLVHLGITSIRAGILSKLGEDALQHYQVQYSYRTLVDRIDCKTEELLQETKEHSAAYTLIKNRAGLSTPD